MPNSGMRCDNADHKVCFYHVLFPLIAGPNFRYSAVSEIIIVTRVDFHKARVVCLIITWRILVIKTSVFVTFGKIIFDSFVCLVDMESGN